MYAAFAFLFAASLASAAPLGLGGLLGTPDEPSAPGRSSFSNPSSRCPNGGTWHTFSDDFSKPDDREWSVETGGSGLKYGKDGLTMTLSEDMAHTGGIVIASRHAWQAPVKMSVEMKTSGDPGIVNPFIFKGSGDKGDEIDLEVVKDTFLLPIWSKGVRLDKDQKGGWDVKQDLRHETKELAHDEYFYKYPGYNPRQWTSYEVDWETGLLLWTVDDNERVQFLKKSDKFPTGPLPIRAGLWSTDPSTDWAGTLDWERNPHPTMQIRRFTIEGCRAD